MLSTRLFLAQRLSALILIPLVITHIIVMIVAIQGGLSVNEILGRTQGSLIWFLFYGTFVFAVSVHGAIGLRVVVHEIVGVTGSRLSLTTSFVFLVLLALGLRAVWAVTYAGVTS